MESNKRAEDIKNLLLKIVLPLAFPLAGSFISDLVRNRANSRHSFTDTSDTWGHLQFDPSSYGSICREEEEEQEEMAESACRASRKFAQSENTTAGGLQLISGFSRQASNNNSDQELLAITGSEEENDASSEVAVISGVRDDHPRSRIMAAEVEEEEEEEVVASLKRLVSGLEERAVSMESMFHDYCEMKEQESAYQKMQIMCLGMKLELLESTSTRNNHHSNHPRLQAAAAVGEEFAAVRGEVERLRSKVGRVARRRRRDKDVVGGRIVALDAEQARLARRCDELERCVEEMKRLLRERKGASNDEEVEVAVERSLRKLSSGRELVDGLEALRDRWAADMEEMIYLGWITAWLQHDLLLLQGGGGDDDQFGFGTVVVGDGEDEHDHHAPADEEEVEHNQKNKKGDTMVAEVAPSNAVRLCKAASSSSSSSSSVLSGPPPRRSVDAAPSSCLGFASASADGAGGRENHGGSGRVLRKLRGWAGGKGGRGKRASCRIAGPCCPPNPK